ncbi:MerR family transcriptional regulator, partial [Brucella melitensis]
MRGQTNAPRMTIADFLVGDGMKAKHEGET